MKFYIATKLERAADHQEMRKQLEALGHEITYDWTTHGSVKNEGEQRIREVARAEFQGIKDADFVIVLLPGGRGTHCEIGIALGLGKRVIIVADPEHGFFAQDSRTCAFYHHPLVVGRFPTTEACIEAEKNGWFTFWMCNNYENA